MTFENCSGQIQQLTAVRFVEADKNSPNAIPFFFREQKVQLVYLLVGRTYESYDYSSRYRVSILSLDSS